MVSIQSVQMGAPSSRASDLVAPFFMFTTSKWSSESERSSILHSLREHVTSRDYLSLALARQAPELATRVGRSHLYVLAPSLKSISRLALACGPGAPGLLIYDGEHWKATPKVEQADMPGAIARGMASTMRPGCYEYGIAPDGAFIGIVPKTLRNDLENSIIHNVDWHGIALFNIQAQRLLGDNTAAAINAYVTFVSAMAREVRTKNSKIIITAQLSFRYTTPETMIAAMHQVRGRVDGFYIAYPSNVGPPCAYCSPQNLDKVLDAL